MLTQRAPSSAGASCVPTAIPIAPADTTADLPPPIRECVTALQAQAVVAAASFPVVGTYLRAL